MDARNKYPGMLPTKMTPGSVLPHVTLPKPGEFNNWNGDDDVQADPYVGGIKDGPLVQLYKPAPKPRILPGQNP